MILRAVLFMHYKQIIKKGLYAYFAQGRDSKRNLYLKFVSTVKILILYAHANL